jgi:hypothetical protein
MIGCQHCGSTKGYDRTYGRCSDCGEPYQAGTTGAHFFTKRPPPPEFFERFKGLGKIPVVPVIAGTWPWGDVFPSTVQFSDGPLTGRTFNTATWAWPLYSGVVAQYREAVAANAMHLMIYRNGMYEVTHVDEISPDLGNPIQHAIVDAPLATTIACGVLGFGVGLVTGLFLFRSGASE